MLAMGDLFVLIQKIDITNKLEDYLGDIRQDIPQIDTICGLHHRHHIIWGWSHVITKTVLEF